MLQQLLLGGTCAGSYPLLLTTRIYLSRQQLSCPAGLQSLYFGSLQEHSTPSLQQIIRDRDRIGETMQQPAAVTAAANLVPAAAAGLQHCSAFSSLASGCSRVCLGTCLGGSTNCSASCSHFQQCASCAVYGLSSANSVGHMHGRPAPRGPSGSISSCRHHHHALYIKLLIQAIATPSAPRPTTSSYEATAAEILGRAAAKYATQQCGI
jgi:hypothetical protein